MDWKKNRLAIAAVVFVALLGAAMWTTQNQHAPSTQSDASTTIEAPARDAIDAIEITRPGGEKVRIEKKGDAYRLVAPIDAEIEKSAIDTVLDRLSELSIRGVAATRPENHARLEVDDAKAIRVVVETKGAKALDILLGAYKSGGTMLRRAGEDRVWIASGSLKHAFQKEVREWRNRQIVDVSASDVREVRLENAKESFHFVRGEDGAWEVGPGQKAIERFDPEAVQSLVSTLARLRTVDFDDARPAPETTGLGDDASRAILTVTSAGGDEPQTIVLRLGKQAPGRTEVYLAREGSPLVYLVSKFTEQSIRPEVARFQKLEEKKSAEATPAPPQGAGEPMSADEMRRFVEGELAKRRAGGP